MIILITEPRPDYELVDSGDGEKLERFGKVILGRPDPQALWRKTLEEKAWKKADGYFTRDEKKGEWKLGKTVPKKWEIDISGLKFWVKPTAFKHVGLFPEQSSNWEWIQKNIERNKDAEPKEILNLFGYTGGATLAAAKAGAKVVHVDGSKAAVSWARENAELSGLKDKPIRWIIDDARTFVKREIKRGRKYDGIIMDPPTFGHGPEGEIWNIENDFISLIESCLKILSDKPIFFLINGYASGYSSIAYENILSEIKEKIGGTVEAGELAIRQGDEKKLLPAGIFARWSAK